MNPKLAGIIYIVVGVIFIGMGVQQSAYDRNYNWVNYVLGAGAIVIGVARLRSKPPVR